MQCNAIWLDFNSTLQSNSILFNSTQLNLNSMQLTPIQTNRIQSNSNTSQFNSNRIQFNVNSIQFYAILIYSIPLDATRWESFCCAVSLSVSMPVPICMSSLLCSIIFYSFLFYDMLLCPSLNGSILAYAIKCIIKSMQFSSELNAMFNASRF